MLFRIKINDTKELSIESSTFDITVDSIKKKTFIFMKTQFFMKINTCNFFFFKWQPLLCYIYVMTATFFYDMG